MAERACAQVNAPRSLLLFGETNVPTLARLGAGLGAAREARMAPNFVLTTPDRALIFLTASAVNPRVAKAKKHRRRLYASSLPSVMGCIAVHRWSIYAAKFSVQLPSN